jgi:hypothetical protein
MRRGVLGLVLAAAVSLAIAAGALAASTRFVEAPSSPEAAGDGAGAVAAADFDGDGDGDLAIANGIANSVTVLRNNGAGNFVEPHSSPEFPGAQPNSIVAADFDADGDADLATANVSSDNVQVLRNNGSGNFLPLSAGPEDVGDNPTWLAAADLDGDEDVDLAVVNQDSDDVSILRNKGNGRFIKDTREGVGDGPRRLVIADFNGDSRPDLAVANSFDGTVTLLRNVGFGFFVFFSQSPIVGASAPSAIVAPDLDGDGKLDLAFTNSGTANVSVFRGLGGGRFRERSTSPEGIGGGLTPLALTAADFDVDGAQDLAVAVSGSDQVAILRNTGSGNLSLTPTSPVTVGDFPLDIAAADLDGDSDLDLATPNGLGDNVTILRNR